MSEMKMLSKVMELESMNDDIQVRFLLKYSIGPFGKNDLEKR